MSHDAAPKAQEKENRDLLRGPGECGKCTLYSKGRSIDIIATAAAAVTTRAIAAVVFRRRHSYNQCCEAECNYKNRRQMPIKLRWQKPEQQQTNPKDAMTKIARQKLMRGNVRPPPFHLCRRLYAIKMKRPQTKWYKLLWVAFASSSHLIFGIKDRPLNYDRRAGKWTDGNVDGQENRERLKFD